MKFEDAAKIIHELLDSNPEQICGEENTADPWIYCSYSTNGKWDMYINRKQVVYRQYYRDILFEVRKASQRKVTISRLDELEFKEFLKDQIRLAQKAKKSNYPGAAE
jgi:hypothetical protein